MDAITNAFDWAIEQLAGEALWALLIAVLGLAVLAARRLWRAALAAVVSNALDGRLWYRKVPKECQRIQFELANSRLPIIMIANHKGGVGKTTLAGNLGAYLAKHHKKRILFVDLDFQGTMSLTFRQIANVIGEKPTAHQIFKDREPIYQNIFNQIKHIQDEKYAGCAFIDLDEELAIDEERTMIKWAIGLLRDDCRFRLARLLHYITKNHSNKFHAVIIDCPPRNSTAEINALAAATHIIIPTRGDHFSAEGAFRFLYQTTQRNKILSQNLRFVGFVETMIRENGAELDSISEVLRPNWDKASKDIQEILQESDPIWRHSVSDGNGGLNADFIAHIYLRQAITQDAGYSWSVDGPPADPVAIMLRTACEAIVEDLRRQGALL